MTARDIAREIPRLLRERLPGDWDLVAVQATSRGPDLDLEVRSPDGRVGHLMVEVKTIVERRDIPLIAEQMRSAMAEHGASVGLVAARYLSPGVREELTARGTSFVDATGNARVVMNEPGLFIVDKGADADPWRNPGRPRGSLKGRPAAQVVRALLDYDRRWRVKELVRVSKASVGATYRVIDYLEREDLVRRDADGMIAPTDWRRLLVNWSRDYGLFTANRVTRWIHPRGIEYGLEAMAGSGSTYAVTGSVAAAEWAPYAPAPSAFAYVSDTKDSAERWGLRPTEISPNFLLIEPDPGADFPFENVRRRSDGLILAAPAQVAADLLNGPGRNPAEAEHLLRWLADNERSWRL